MKQLPLFFVLIISIMVLIAIIIATMFVSPTDTVILVGYKASPMLSLVYLSSDTDSLENQKLKIEFIELGTTNEVGYSLISGKIDAGFVDPQSAIHLLKADETKQIKIAGAVTFPYGAHPINLNLVGWGSTGLYPCQYNNIISFAYLYHKSVEPAGISVFPKKMMTKIKQTELNSMGFAMIRD